MALLILVTACAPAPAPTASAGLKVMATTTILADFARNISGDRASVESLLPPGADPHAYQPTPQDEVRVSESNLLIENGAGYERAFQSMLDDASGQRLTITASQGLNLGSTSGDVNPHFWVNPQFATKYVENIRDGLIKADPANAETYTANAKAYLLKLGELDRWTQEQVSALPPGRRLLVTNHDSLGYFADRYGFKVLGVIIPSSSDEAGAAAQQLAAIVDAVKSSGAPAIFLDKVENPALAQQIANETGASVVDDLYFESLSAAGGPASTYLDMMRHDVTRIVSALQP